MSANLREAGAQKALPVSRSSGTALFFDDSITLFKGGNLYLALDFAHRETAFPIH
jgi:hypothetical protein